MDKPVVIVGSGFAGLSCAFHLAQAGKKVVVLEKKNVPGGYFPELQRQFPTNSCGVCFMHPEYPAYCPYIEAERHHNIDVVLNASVGKVVPSDGSVTVTYDVQGASASLDASALVFATGYELYDISGRPELGGGIYSNVLSSIEMERKIYDCSARAIRPDLRNVAYIQCVGSRDLKIGRPYCSSFCCMFAVKQAVMLKELSPEINVTIFYMDLRAFGKDYERYYREAQEKGVRFVRSAVAAVRKRPATGLLELLYTKDNAPVEETFDTVVLSQGAGMDSFFLSMMSALGMPVDTYHPVVFSDREIQPGIYVAGSCYEPMDIPDSVTDGIYVASRILEKQGVTIADSGSQKPATTKARSISVAGIALDDEQTKAIREKYEKMTALNDIDELEHHIQNTGCDSCVVVARDVRVLENKIKEKASFGLHLNSIMLVSSASLNLMEEIDSAVYRLQNVQKTPYAYRALNHTVLVIGGGLAGLVASRNLSRLGHSVVLVEKGSELGGRLRTVPERRSMLNAYISDIENEGKVEILKGSLVSKIEGRMGDFSVTIESAGEVRKTRVGAVLITTGGEPRQKVHPAYDGDRVLTVFELEGRKETVGQFGSIVFLQCAGSRIDENPVCYRVCCNKAVETAIDLKTKNSEMQISILHKDIRTYGYNENLYRLAREKGIQFVRMMKEPVITRTDKTVTVSVMEEGTGSKFDIHSECLLLSSGVDPNTKDIKGLIGFDTQDGFIVPYNKKSGVLDIKPGIYAAGLCLAPAYTPDVIKQAASAALRIALKLTRKEIATRFNTAFVVEKYCCGCELCVKACPVSARYIDTDKKIAVVDETLCEGCGTCAMVCANKASQHKVFEHKSMLKTIDMMI